MKTLIFSAMISITCAVSPLVAQNAVPPVVQAPDNANQNVPAPSVGDQYFSNGCNDGSCGSGPLMGERIRSMIPRFEYFSTFGGWSGVKSFADPTAAAPNVSLSFKDGYTFGGALGREIRPNLRLEGEFAYRQNSGDVFTGPIGTGDASGDLKTYSWMTNIYRDFGKCGTLRPYIGAGIGAAWMDGTFQVPNLGAAYITDDSAFAWQTMAGLTMKLGCRSTLFAEYRYFTTDGIEFRGGTALPAVAVSGEFDNTSHNVFFGIKVLRR